MDSSSLSSGPSRKRCRSPTASIPSSSLSSGPSRKRCRDSYSSEDSREEDMEVDTIDVEADADVVASTADTKKIIVDPLAIGDSFESSRG
ncbi:hypothetical protein Tco_0388407, partial [Tanacetum coccineum]